MKKLKFLMIVIILQLYFLSSHLFAQVQFLTHKRGMLHQSIGNQGSLGQVFSDVAAMPAVPQASMEWPPYSMNVINNFEYPGQHNSPGSSVWIGYTSLSEDINGDGFINSTNRWLDRAIAPGGGVARFDGKVTPVIDAGWIFPLDQRKITNYQVLEDGSLNPDYNPNEADEMIISKWATWIGVTVTRVSRVWSDPDYDDLVIYELTFENTGNTDYDESTIELPDSTFKDFTIFLRECFSPSQLGYWRLYNRSWSGRWKEDPQYYYDNDYWLAFQIDGETNLDGLLAGKPEPNPERFFEWSKNSHNGGGMLAHQAPGYCILHYDTEYLAKVYPRDSLNIPDPRNESDMDRFLYKKPGDEIDEAFNLFNQLNPLTNTLKQPLMYFNHDGQVGDYGGWMGDGWMDAMGVSNSNISEIMYEGHEGLPERNQEDWIGRRIVQNGEEQRKPITMGTVFGPYTLPPDAKINISYAEVVGYGGAARKLLPGGPLGDWKNEVPTSDRKLKSAETNEILTEHYLTDFGYPDHVNSDVITVEDVAHKAWELYLGRSIPFDPSYSGPASGEKLWPEDTDKLGAYHGTVTNEIQWPSPNFELGNTALAKTKISWSNAVENFDKNFHVENRMKGELVKYKVYRSTDKQGWDLVGSLDVGQLNIDGEYVIEDTASVVKIGNSFYYTVVAVDSYGNESSRMTFIKSHSPTVSANDKLGKVYAVPNPFYVKSGFTGTSASEDYKITFYGLTKNSTIRIFSVAGQLIQTIHHNTDSTSNLGSPFYQVTVNNQRFAAGVYFFVVTDEDTGDVSKGKFIVIR